MSLKEKLSHVRLSNAKFDQIFNPFYPTYNQSFWETTFGSKLSMLLFQYISLNHSVRLLYVDMMHNVMWCDIKKCRESNIPNHFKSQFACRSTHFFHFGNLLVFYEWWQWQHLADIPDCWKLRSCHITRCDAGSSSSSLASLILLIPFQKLLNLHFFWRRIFNSKIIFIYYTYI